MKGARLQRAPRMLNEVGVNAFVFRMKATDDGIQLSERFRRADGCKVFSGSEHLNGERSQTIPKFDKTRDKQMTVFSGTV